MDVLFDRCVEFIDEVEEIIQERGGQTRYQALAILRERKAASRTTTSGWRKEPVTFAVAGSDDAGYYRKLLDGVDPVLPQQLAAAPAVNSLTLRVSWPPRHCAATGFIASSHDNLLALCLGSCYRHDWRHLPGCYLVLNTRAKSVAVVPPLPPSWVEFVNDHPHCPIGSGGVAVLRTDDGYLLAELYRHTRRDELSDYLPTNEATLFMWCSPGSGSGSGGGPRADADQWIRKEVVLPLPVPDEDAYCFNFDAGTVFAVSSTSLCWVDLWAGILVCNNISSSSSTDDDGLVFTFIPLPAGCALGSFDATEYRSVCCVDSETIKLLCMDDGGGEVTLALTTWTLKFPLTDSWRWEKDEDASCSSLCVADLLDDAIPVVSKDGGGKRRLLRRVVRWPVISRAQPGVAHVSVHDFEYKRRDKDWEATGLYEVSLDVPRRRVASVFTFPAGSSPPGRMVMAL